MTNFLKNRCTLFALALGLTLTSSWAQPSGQLTFGFDATDSPVWDLSGPYQLTTPIAGAGGQEIPLSYAIGISQNVKGTLRGQGTALVRIGNETVGGSYTVTGSVRGNGSFTKADFSVTISGNGTLSGGSRKFKITAKYKMEVDPEDLVLKGEVKGSITISGAGSGRIADYALSLPLPAGVDGSWQIDLSFIPLSKLSGSGNVFVSSFFSPDSPPDLGTERVFPVIMKGSYSESRNLSKISLSGTGEGKGVSMSLKVLDTDVLQEAKGKLMGQKVVWTAPPPAL